MCLCLSVREHISGTARPIGTKFCAHITVAVARSFSGCVAIRYVLPVLRMTSRLTVMCCVATRGDTGAKSDVYSCLVLTCVFSKRVKEREGVPPLASLNVATVIGVKAKSKAGVQQFVKIHHTATGNHMPHSVSCHPAPAAVSFPPLPQPKLVHDLASPEGCKAELT